MNHEKKEQLLVCATVVVIFARRILRHEITAGAASVTSPGSAHRPLSLSLSLSLSLLRRAENPRGRGRRAAHEHEGVGFCVARARRSLQGLLYSADSIF